MKYSEKIMRRCECNKRYLANGLVYHFRNLGMFNLSWSYGNGESMFGMSQVRKNYMCCYKGYWRKTWNDLDE